MPPQFPDFRRIRRRVKRSLNYGLKKNASLNLPLQDMVINYFDRHCPYDYMRPEISANISHCGFADPCSFVVALIYLERLRSTDQEYFESSDPADLYLPALVLASKYLHDSDTWDRATNSEWADAADIEPEHLNTLEWDFVKRLNWNTIVRADEFDNVLKTVECYAANYNVEQNGVATYNELFQLASSIPCSSYMGFLQDFFSYIGFMGLVYTITLFSVLAVPAKLESMDIANASTSLSPSQPSSPHVPLVLSHQRPVDKFNYPPPRAPTTLSPRIQRRGPSVSPSIAINSALSNPVIPISSVSLFQPFEMEIGAPLDYENPLFKESFNLFKQPNLTEVCA